MIELMNIRKTYYGKDIETNVLKGVNLTVDSGEFVCIYGSSGSGKSTLLNIIGLLDQASEGEYLLDGVDINQLKDKQKAAIRNQRIGFVFQAYHLIQEMNVLENIVVPLGYAGMSKKERTKRAQELLNEFHMEHLKKKHISQLSGGEQQRISIMRALSNKPEILLADELTGHLDSENSKKVMEILKHLNEKGMTIIMVTHDLTLAEYGSRIIHIEDGKIVER